MNEIDDADQHVAWEAQQQRDPHRVCLDGLTGEQRNAYVLWHSNQRRIIRRSLRDAGAARKALGLPYTEDPIAAAQLAHHDAMLRRIQALLPPNKPPKVKRPPARSAATPPAPSPMRDAGSTCTTVQPADRHPLGPG